MVQTSQMCDLCPVYALNAEAPCCQGRFGHRTAGPNRCRESLPQPPGQPTITAGGPAGGPLLSRAPLKAPFDSAHLRPPALAFLLFPTSSDPLAVLHTLPERQFESLPLSDGGICSSSDLAALGVIPAGKTHSMGNSFSGNFPLHFWPSV